MGEFESWLPKNENLEESNDIKANLSDYGDAMIGSSSWILTA